MPRAETPLAPFASPDLARRLAYRSWEERGRPIGSPEHDWFRAEQHLRRRFLEERPRQVVCGIDDFATGTGVTSGWTYFTLPESAVSEFSRRAGELLPTGVDEFHASENFNDHPAAFEEFLKLIRDTVESNHYSRVRIVANSRTWKDEFSGFAMRMLENAFQQAGVTDQAIISACKACAPPLFTMLRVLEDFGNTTSVHIQVDRDDKSAPFATLNNTVSGTSLTARHLFAIALNTYSDSRFPHAPRVEKDGTSIELLDSKLSWIVQASDVIGNLAMNYAYKDVGATTQGRLRKARIFEDVFGRSFSRPNPREFFSNGGGEISPLEPGAVSLDISNLPELDFS